MGPISSVDRVVLLLRRRLEERERLQKGKHAEASRQPPLSRDGIQALSSTYDPEDANYRRAFVQTLLADHFGEDMINDAKFQQIITRVIDLIEEDDNSSNTVTRLLRDMKTRSPRTKRS